MLGCRGALLVILLSRLRMPLAIRASFKWDPVRDFMSLCFFPHSRSSSRWRGVGTSCVEENEERMGSRSVWQSRGAKARAGLGCTWRFCKRLKRFNQKAKFRTRESEMFLLSERHKFCALYLFLGPSRNATHILWQMCTVDFCAFSHDPLA